MPFRQNSLIITMANKNYYEILGIDEAAGFDAIKKSYRKLAKENHPDTHPGDETT